MSGTRFAGIGAGDLRELVTLYERVRTVDAHGAPVAAWQAAARVRAAVVDAPYRPKETQVAGVRQAVAANTVDLVIRRREGVNVRMQVEVAGRRFDVASVTNLEMGRKRYLRLFCTEVQG